MDGKDGWMNGQMDGWIDGQDKGIGNCRQKNKQIDKQMNEEMGQLDFYLPFVLLCHQLMGLEQPKMVEPFVLLPSKEQLNLSGLTHLGQE